MTFGTEGEYTGHFVAGQRSGEGVFKYLKTKDLYSGSWKNGLKHGKGIFIFFDTKMKLVGDWFNGQIMKGKCIFANGTYFEGKFENIIMKLEEKERFLTKLNFLSQLQKKEGFLENKIEIININYFLLMIKEIIN